MNFRPELLTKVLNGTKTQTRRIVHPGEHIGTSRGGVTGVLDGRDRLKWQVGKSYAVAPGRSRRGVARFRLLSIRCDHDVRAISMADAIAEGFGSQDEFIRVWATMHDKSLDQTNLYFYLKTRPRERYIAWALTFEVVQP